MRTVKIDIERRLEEINADTLPKKLPWNSYDLAGAIEVADGVLKFIHHHGWCEGYRNNIAVDLSIACYYLGLKPIPLIEDALELKFEAIPGCCYDSEGAKDRFLKVEQYIERWYYRPSDYYLSAWMWRKLSRNENYCHDAEHLAERLIEERS